LIVWGTEKKKKMKRQCAIRKGGRAEEGPVMLKRSKKTGVGCVLRTEGEKKKGEQRDRHFAVSGMGTVRD